VFKKADYHMGKVKQTADAVLDAQVMTYGTELAGKRLNNSLKGNAGIGVDVDQFVSRCIQFMRSGGDPDADIPARGGADDEDEELDEGLDWACFGREACFPFNSRPPTSSFLLGPLSVQKRARPTPVRKARSQRQPTGPVTRPQELQQSDIKQSENSNLTHLVTNIETRLKKHLQVNEAKIQEDLDALDEEDEEVMEAHAEVACRRHRTYRTKRTQESAVQLFDFVINPHSFGQTVENMFYTSFLIREGRVKVVTGDDAGEEGLPLLGEYLHAPPDVLCYIFTKPLLTEHSPCRTLRR
jgi:hypothetical protein